MTVPSGPVVDTTITSSSNSPLVGGQYMLNCTSTAIPGFTQSPTITWTHQNRTAYSTSSIVFDKLLASDGGSYTCTSVLTSPALDTPNMAKEEYNLTVQCKHVPHGSLN